MQNHSSTNAAHYAASSISSTTPAATLTQKLLQRLGARKTPPENAAANTEEAINIFDHEAMNAARKNALAWVDWTLKHADGSEDDEPEPAPELTDIPEAVLQGIISEALLSQRFFLSFKGMLRGAPIELVTVPKNACVVDFDKDKASFIAEMVPRSRIMELIEALAQRANDKVFA